MVIFECFLRNKTKNNGDIEICRIEMWRYGDFWGLGYVDMIICRYWDISGCRDIDIWEY